MTLRITGNGLTGGIWLDGKHITNCTDVELNLDKNGLIIAKLTLAPQDLDLEVEPSSVTMIERP